MSLHEEWRKIEGDKTLLLKHPFKSDAVVFEIGAYKGKWVESIHNLYRCHIYAFEPVRQFYQEMTRKFKNEDRIHIKNYGISNKSGIFRIRVQEDASSFYIKDGKEENIELKSVLEVFSEISMPEVDLMQINIEGGEYDLIEALLDTGLISKIRKLQVQFHNCVENSEARYKKIKNRMLETHTVAFSYPFLWEGWEIKKPTVLIRDSNFFNKENPKRSCPYFNWLWDTTNRAGEITVFSDCYLQEACSSKSEHKVAWLVEPPEINPHMYNMIKNIESNFDLIFTFSESLLKRDDRYRFFTHGSSWVHPPDRSIYNKTKMTSAIFSKKNYTSGHKFRHIIAKRLGEYIDLMGHGYRSIDKKVEGLKNYRFHVVVENCCENFYFSEKLVDCFYTGTVPIYYGFPQVSDFFDIGGIIQFKTIEELEAILKSLTPEMYEERKKHIQNNFLRADEYVVMEKSMWLNGIKDIFS